MKIELSVEYAPGDTVFLVTDAEQSEHIVVGYDVDADLNVKYKIRLTVYESLHSGIELSRERDTVKTLGINTQN